MNLRRSSFAGIAVLVVCMTGLVNVAIAAQEDAATKDMVARGDLQPAIPLGRGESCVKESAFMRRNHMDMLEHQRDDTTLNGVRSKQYSLKECINCHAVYGPDAIPLSAANPRHFCRSCHDYAAVSIDCFECHASRPESGANGSQ